MAGRSSLAIYKCTIHLVYQVKGCIRTHTQHTQSIASYYINSQFVFSFQKTPEERERGGGGERERERGRMEGGETRLGKGGHLVKGDRGKQN